MLFLQRETEGKVEEIERVEGLWKLQINNIEMTLGRLGRVVTNAICR